MRPSRQRPRLLLPAWLLALALCTGWSLTDESPVSTWLPEWMQDQAPSQPMPFDFAGPDALFGIPLADVADDLLLQQIASLTPQRPGQVDLYAIGVAGDASEAVFANEVHHFTALMTQRFGADGRTLALMNRSRDRLRREQLPVPPAHLVNLRAALQGAAGHMDPAEDLLLLYLTMHGTNDPLLHLQRADGRTETWSPRQLRDALDDAGIRNRIIVISACYSGGFEPELANPHTLLITAARDDRPSFGCGAESTMTWFGRGWLLEGLARHADPVQAFRHADQRIQHWEQLHDQERSHPQLWVGNSISDAVDDWRRDLALGPLPPYWYPLDDPDVAANPERVRTAEAPAAHDADTP